MNFLTFLLLAYSIVIVIVLSIENPPVEWTLIGLQIVAAVVGNVMLIKGLRELRRN